MKRLQNNDYCYSKKHKCFTLKNVNKLDCFNEDEDLADIEQKYSGIFTGNRIKYEFANTSQLLFETTNACNLKCEYCAYGELYNNYGTRERDFLTFPKAKNLIDFYINLSSLLKSHNKKLSIGFYGGEPLLNFKLIQEVIDYVDNIIPDCKFSMTTNGTLLNKYIDYIVEKKFNLLISLDGNFKNNSFRVYQNGLTSFPSVFKNIKILQLKYSNYFQSCVNFSAVLHSRNSISEIIEFFKSEFDKVPKISELSPVGIKEDKEYLYNQNFKNINNSLNSANNVQELIEVMDVDVPARRALAYFLFDHSGNVFKSYNDLFNNQLIVKFPTATCEPFSRKVFLSAKGKLYPCERIGQTLDYGEVTESVVNIDFESIAFRHNEYYKKIKSQCFKCGLLDVCTKCMLQMIEKDSNPKCKSMIINDKLFQEYSAFQLSFLEKEPDLFNHIWETYNFE